MVHTDRIVISLIRSYAAARSLSESYASAVLTGSGDTVRRVESGMSLTGRRVEKIISKASFVWPSDLPWPSDIPRPTPNSTPNSTPKEAA